MTMTRFSEELLYPEELAAALRRSRTYVFAMKRAGFPMPGGSATLTEAREWLLEHPGFRSNQMYSCKPDTEVDTKGQS